MPAWMTEMLSVSLVSKDERAEVLEPQRPTGNYYVREAIRLLQSLGRQQGMGSNLSAFLPGLESLQGLQWPVGLALQAILLQQELLALPWSWQQSEIPYSSCSCFAFRAAAPRRPASTFLGSFSCGWVTCVISTADIFSSCASAFTFFLSCAHICLYLCSKRIKVISYSRSWFLFKFVMLGSG